MQANMEKQTDPWAFNPSREAPTADDNDEEEAEGLLHTNPNVKRRRSPFSNTVLSVLCCVLLLIVVAQNVALFLWNDRGDDRPAAYSSIGLRTVKDQVRIAGVSSVYWDFDELNRSTEAWEAIRAGHGVVALTPEFVAEHNLPPTIDLMDDPEHKKVYAIESYHMMHCVQWLRRGYVALKTGGIDEDHPMEHVLHCFEALRQSIMCQANDELLTLTGHGHERGYNQTRHCKNWDALREFASANSACYYDAPAGPIWGKCDGGVDGLPVGNLW